VDFNVNYVESTQVNNINDTTRENITFQPAIRWEMTPEWSISGSYRYRSQDTNQDDFGNLTSNNSAESHLMMLTINYNWQGLSISR
jgi:hypothetical protein